MSNVGIVEHELTSRFAVSQNIPHPFDGVTDFSLNLPYEDKVVLEVFEITGRKVTQKIQRLPAGAHTFRVMLKTPQTYLLSVKTSREHASIKMVNQGNKGFNKIEYKEEGAQLMYQLKSEKGNSNHLFMPGDEMRYVGFMMLYNNMISSDTIQQVQNGDDMIELMFQLWSSGVIPYYCIDTTALLIPDGIACNGSCITTKSFNVTGYSISSTIQSANDIQYVRLKMEHSFIGDLWISITCPNGQSATIMNKYGNANSNGCSFEIPQNAWGWLGNAGSSDSHFGLYYEPDGTDKCDPIQNPMGTCWNYCWSNNTTSGYQYACGDGHVYEACNHIITNNPHGLMQTNYVVSTDVANMTNVYHPDVSFDNLIGCPLNGIWSIEIVDGVSINNGYISETEIAFAGDTVDLCISLPNVITSTVLSLTKESAVCGGNVIYDGLRPVTMRGICWDTTSNPTIADLHTLDGQGEGHYTTSLTNLTPSTTYYYRAYAVNSLGVGYGQTLSFTTNPNTTPTITTASVTNITGYSAISGGEVNDDGGFPVTTRGICWSTSHNPTIANNFTTDSYGIGSFTSNLTNLTTGTTYYVRSYATNSLGTAYGNEVSFTTLSLPSLAINLVTNITNSSAHISGQVYSNYSTIIANGFCWSTSPNPTLADNHSVQLVTISSSSFDYTIMGLIPGTTYYVNAYATNIAGTNYTNQRTFTTTPLPLVSTDSVIVVSDTSALIACNVIADGFLPISQRGVCWSTSQNPTVSGRHTVDGGGTGIYYSSITGISLDSIYYSRAYAINSYGTSYGNEIGFTTRSIYGQPCPNIPTVTDYDGNVYNTVQIGTQCWIKENMRTTHFADGTAISLVPYSTISHFTPYRYYPNNDSTIVDPYGYLYNWKAAMKGAESSNSIPSGVQGLCPDGWHLPSSAEWSILRNYVISQNQYMCGSNPSAIGKALASTTGWEDSGSLNPCTPGYIQLSNNETGFTAFPAGETNFAFGRKALFWSSKASYSSSYGGYSINYSLDNVVYSFEDYNENLWYEGYSVRCLKD